ncbi:MAG: High-affinity iron permease [Rickettsiaceae bacterium]|jgi:high-affinity iron transporter|nr:High-affinity iron permease [Rickettsiaceae bacterium]
MLKIAIIVFREIFEIALVISILVAATNGVKGRNKWIFAGIGLGIAGSLLLAFFTDNISSSLDGTGQEVFNAIILLISSAMVSWTIIWMKKYGKQISADLKQLGKSVAQGDQSLFAIMPVVAFTVLREGAEIVLFGYGSFASGDNIFDLISGAIAGLLCGLVVGFAFYYGLIKVLSRHLFTVTSWLLIFLAAGMVAQAIGFLSNAGIISEIFYPVWDSSFLISEQGLLGKILHALFGYIAKPSAAQLIGYATVVLGLVIGLNYERIGRKKS